MASFPFDALLPELQGHVLCSGSLVTRTCLALTCTFLARHHHRPKIALDSFLTAICKEGASTVATYARNALQARFTHDQLENASRLGHNRLVLDEIAHIKATSAPLPPNVKDFGRFPVAGAIREAAARNDLVFLEELRDALGDDFFNIEETEGFIKAGNIEKLSVDPHHKHFRTRWKLDQYVQIWGNAETIEWYFHTHCPEWPIEVGHINGYISRNVHPSTLSTLHTKLGLPLNVHAIENAIVADRLENFIYAGDPNWKNARDYLIIAAQYRIFRIVDWLVAQRGIDPRSLSEDELYSVYHFSDDRSFLDLYKRDFPASLALIQPFIPKAEVPELRVFLEMGWVPTTAPLIQNSRRTYEQRVKFLHSHGLVLTTEVFQFAVECNSRDSFIDWLLRIGCPWDKFVFLFMMRIGHKYTPQEATQRMRFLASRGVVANDDIL